MKSLYKKISAVALVGMIVAGGCLLSGLNVHADQLSEKYKKEIYNGELPNAEKYNVPLGGLLGNDDDSEVKKIMEEIDKVIKSKKFDSVKFSSEYGEIYEGGVWKKVGIEGFLEGIKDIVGEDKVGGSKFFEESQAFFDNVKDFESYMKEYSHQIKDGLYRVYVGGVEVIFRAKK